MSNVKEMRDEIREFKRELEEAKISFREINNIFTDYIALARRLGLPTDITEQMATIQRLRITAEMMYRTIMMLEVVSGPIGWLQFIAQVGLVAFTAIQEVEIRRSHY